VPGVDLKDGLAVLALIWILFPAVVTRPGRQECIERCGRGCPVSRALSQTDGLRCADMRGKQ